MACTESLVYLRKEEVPYNSPDPSGNTSSAVRDACGSAKAGLRGEALTQCHMALSIWRDERRQRSAPPNLFPVSSMPSVNV